jgi:hypothetical protein
MQGVHENHTNAWEENKATKNHKSLSNVLEQKYENNVFEK